MIFNIDVRQVVCRKFEEKKRLIELKASLDIIRKEEIDKNEKIANKLLDVIAIMNEIIDLKTDEEKEVLNKFEKDFVIDVLNDTDFYKDRLNLS